MKNHCETAWTRFPGGKIVPDVLSFKKRRIESDSTASPYFAPTNRLRTAVLEASPCTLPRSSETVTDTDTHFAKSHSDSNRVIVRFPTRIRHLITMPITNASSSSTQVPKPDLSLNALENYLLIAIRTGAPLTSNTTSTKTISSSSVNSHRG